MEFRACGRRQRRRWTNNQLPAAMPLTGRVTYQLLTEVTDNFSKERELGAGASGKVFKGVTKYGKQVAVKLLYQRPGLDDHLFENELKNLMFLKHPNIVSFLCYCNETHEVPVEFNRRVILAEKINRALCFEYMENGNLKRHLYDESCGPDWNTRYKIIKGICDGLKYIHKEVETPIYHLDLKPENILLDKNMVPKLADFGLSKMLIDDKTRSTSNPYGTHGYIPPEYINRNLISSKFDIFSLGVVIIKIVTGPTGYTESADMSEPNFIDQAQRKWRKRLQAECNGSLLNAYCQQVKICIELALNCVEKDRNKRPGIVTIIHRLRETENLIDKLKSDLLDKAVGAIMEAIGLGSTMLHGAPRATMDATIKVSMPELSYLFNNEQPTIEEVRHVFNVLDDTIATHMPELSFLFNTEEPTLDEALCAFAMFDVNGDGFIDAVDLQVVLKRLGIPQDATVCHTMIVTASRGSSDGRMNLSQFIPFLFDGLRAGPLLWSN